jgi:regulator of sigma E protease
MSFPQIILGIIFLGILVIVHEFGHFIVAKKIGVRVLTFSIGFGRKLIRRRWGDTEYCISSIPFGGYVRMEGEDPGDKRSAAPTCFYARSVPERIAIALAGPVLNLIFAFLVLWILFMAGVPGNRKLVISYMFKNSPAIEQGLLVNDQILAIDGKKMHKWEEVLYEVITHKNTPLDFQIMRNGEVLNLTITPNDSGEDGTGYIGINFLGSVPAVVGSLQTGMPAERAGLEVGDTILKVGETAVKWFHEISTPIQDKKGESVDVRIKRRDSVFNVAITPVFHKKTERYLLGFNALNPIKLDLPIVKYGVIKAAGKSLEKCVDDMFKIYEFLKFLALRQISAKVLGGPLDIVVMLGVSTVQWHRFVFLLAMISTNLAVVNLIPFLIISDGGMISFFILESVRGRPLKQKTQLTLQKIALILMIMLFLFVTYNGVLRMFRWFGN